jgi:hypothetical protein
MIDAPSGQRKSAHHTAIAALQRKQLPAWREYRHKLRDWERLPRNQRNDTPKPDTPRTYIAMDSTPEELQHILAATDHGAFLVRDELAAVFGFGRYARDKGVAERSFYLEAYEGGPYMVSRKTTDSFLIEVNAVVIFGYIQPERLRKFADLDEDGLLQRFFPLRAAPATVSQEFGEIIGKAKFDDTISRLAEGFAREYTTNREGTDIIRRMEADAVEFARYSELGLGFQGFCGKLHGSLARLALILHLLDDPDASPNVVIHPDTVGRADRAVREFIVPHAYGFYASLVPDRIDLTRNIAAWLLTKAPVQPAAIRASDFGKHIRALRNLDLASLNRALDPFVTGGWLHPETPFPNNRRWFLDPGVRVVLAHRIDCAQARREENRKLAERIGKT